MDLTRLRTGYLRMPLTLCLLICLLFGMQATGAPQALTTSKPEVVGGRFADWQRWRDSVGVSDGVVRYYPFDAPATGDRDAPFPNVAGDKSEPLTVSRVPAASATPETFAVGTGRWPAKRGVRLDQSCLVTKAPDLGGKAFTATLWFRTHGQGAHRGNDGATNGMLLCVGNGYYDGWRVVIQEPSRRMSLEIGRPTGSVGSNIQTEPVADNVWHHLAATWDGNTARLYLDGSLAAEYAYSGDYTPPGNGQFRIGYADSGVGSVVLDTDEAALYRRALPPDEVLRHAFFYTHLSPAQTRHWVAADAAFAQKNNTVAESVAQQELNALLATTGLHQDMKAQARLRLADVLREQGKGEKVATLLPEIMDTTALPTRIHEQASQNLLIAVLQDTGTAYPTRLYARLLAFPQLTPDERRSLRLSRGHSLVGTGNLAAARTEYAALWHDPNTPVVWRSVAGMCVARAYLRAGNYAAAKATYLAVKALPGLPRYTGVEIDERLGEVARLQAGKPAQDPLAGQTRLPAHPAPGLTFYVAPKATKKVIPNGTRQRPFATLEEARDAIRARCKRGGLPAGGVTVIVRGGHYLITQTWALTAEDSGTTASPIVYRAALGERPIFDGGATVKGFGPVTDTSILARLPDEARDKVRQTNLRQQGITDLGTYTPGGFGSARGFKTHPMLELFFNGRAMPLAHWPNDGYIRIADVVPGTKDTFTYSDERVVRWKDEKDAWLYGYWFYDWADSYEKVGAIDPDRKTITLAPPVTTYGDGNTPFKRRQRFRAVNVLSEIDTPGEWYLDRETGILYFYPPSDPARANVSVSLLETPIVTLENVSHVTLEGLVFENGRGDGIIITKGANCLLHGCTVQQFGGNGVQIDGGVRHGLLACDIHTLGRGGTVITGGDRKTLAPGGHFIENCTVYDFSRIDHTYTPAVLLYGVGNRIAHNLFHHSYSSAMRIDGNDNIIEYNEVRNVLLESDDQGAADMWANFTYRGNIFRYNYWHDMGNGLGVGQSGIRLDDFISGTVIYGNIFQRCADGGFGAVQINQGADNTIANNLFVDCKNIVSGGAGSPEAWKRFITGQQGKGYNDDVRAQQPPYSVRYPELLRLGQDPQNSILRNIALHCGGNINTHRADAWENSITARNPGFVAPEQNNFALVAGSPLANRLSFQPIPFRAIGLYPTPFRAQVLKR